MKTTILLSTLVPEAHPDFIGNLWFCFGFIPAALLVGLVIVVWALRSAPEGYENETGFQFRETRTANRDSAGMAMLRPHNVS